MPGPLDRLLAVGRATATSAVGNHSPAAAGLGEDGIGVVVHRSFLALALRSLGVLLRATGYGPVTIEERALVGAPFLRSGG
jgi:hypothetical protein